MADRLTSHRVPRRLAGSTLLIAALVVPSAPSISAEIGAAATDFSVEPSWQPASPDAAFQQLEFYLRSQPLSPERQSTIRDAWWQGDAPSSLSANELLDRLAECLALSDQRVAELVEFCAGSERPAVLPDFAWLANSDVPALLRYNMRLYYARWLGQNEYYDEAIAWTDGLTPADVVAPEALLFYRAVASHQLVKADRADATVAELLLRSDELPLRYQKLAALMQQDLAGLEDDSLDHIARRMADVKRRLELGRAGKPVQLAETGVVESLDRLIKELEDQAQKQQQSASSSSGGSPSGTPMQDSRLAPFKAPGKVDPRDLGDGADWGDMPAKEREQALQDVGRDFPSHYREVIEEYFRRLAAEESAEQP
jgi:hypothetical protein